MTLIMNKRREDEGRETYRWVILVDQDYNGAQSSVKINLLSSNDQGWVRTNWLLHPGPSYLTYLTHLFTDKETEQDRQLVLVSWWPVLTRTREHQRTSSSSPVCGPEWLRCLAGLATWGGSDNESFRQEQSSCHNYLVFNLPLLNVKPRPLQHTPRLSDVQQFNGW